MSIREGEHIPHSVISQMSDEGPQTISTEDYFSGRKIVLFSVPGAFTPTCSAYHLPGFIEHLQEIRGKGIDADHARHRKKFGNYRSF